VGAFTVHEVACRGAWRGRGKVRGEEGGGGGRRKGKGSIRPRYGPLVLLPSEKVVSRPVGFAKEFLKSPALCLPGEYISHY
jgi:hypothetical protein